MRILLQHGASSLIFNRKHHSPLHYANNLDIFAILKSAMEMEKIQQTVFLPSAEQAVIPNVAADCLTNLPASSPAIGSSAVSSYSSHFVQSGVAQDVLKPVVTPVCNAGLVAGSRRLTKSQSVVSATMQVLVCRYIFVNSFKLCWK